MNKDAPREVAHHEGKEGPALITSIAVSAELRSALLAIAIIVFFVLAMTAALTWLGTETFEQSRRERKKIEMRFAHLKRIPRLGRLRLCGPRGAQDEFILAATRSEF